MHREPRVLEAEAQVGKWFDCRARITSKELAQLHSVKNGILLARIYEANGGEESRTQRDQADKDLPLLVFGIPEAGKWQSLEIKGDCKTIVDWAAMPR